MWAATECPASGNGPSTKVEDKKRTWSGVAVLSLCSHMASAAPHMGGCPTLNSTLVHFDINNESRCDVNDPCRCLKTCYPETFGCLLEDWFTVDGHYAKWWFPYKAVTCTANGFDTEISICQTESSQVQAQTTLIKAPKGHHRNNVTSCAYVIGRPGHLEDRFDKDALKGEPNSRGFYDVTPKVELYDGWNATENEKTLFLPVERPKNRHMSSRTLKEDLELVKAQAKEDGVDYAVLIIQPKAFIPRGGKKHSHGERLREHINRMLRWMGDRFEGIKSIMFSYQGSEPPSRNKTISWDEKCPTKNDSTDWFWGKVLGGTLAATTLVGGIAAAVYSSSCIPSFRRGGRPSFHRGRQQEVAGLVKNMEVDDEDSFAGIELNEPYNEAEAAHFPKIIKESRQTLLNIEKEPNVAETTL